MITTLLLTALLAFTAAQGQAEDSYAQVVPAIEKARSSPLYVLGLLPPPPPDATSQNQVPDDQTAEKDTGSNAEGRSFIERLRQSPEEALKRGSEILSVLTRQRRSPNPHHVEGHVGNSTHEHKEDHDHSAHTHDEHTHEHTEEVKEGEAKSRKKRGYCSRCGGQIGYGGGGYGGGGLGGGYGGGCGSNCGGGGGYIQRPVYQQPIYQQPIYQQRPNYGGGGGICSVCGQPQGGYGGGGYGGGGGQSFSQSSSQSSASSYGKK